jgi:serine/threonine protein kinase
MNDQNDRTRPSLAQPVSSTLGSRGGQQNQFASGDIIEERYRIISVIGHGGFGCVYKVHQLMLNKQFALKTLNPVHATEVTIMRLQKEGQAASRLEHRNLVRAVDFGMINGVQPFLVMELISGPTFADYLKEHGRLPLAEALQIFIPIAQALAYAHGQGIIHRDLKPSNVMLANDESGFGLFIPKIVDFGIAKIQFADDGHAMTLTSTGDVFGTPLYMSPEQCAGSAIDARTDIYSLGCMLFEALTGAPPFTGRNALEIMMQHGTGTVPSLKQASMGEIFPRQIERIISLTLAKNPNERYSNCQRLADDLLALQQGDFDRISTIAQTGAVLPRPSEKQQSLVYIVIAAVVFGLLGATLGFLSATLRAVPAPAKHEEDSEEKYLSPSLPGLRDESSMYSYFSNEKDGKIVFNFPWQNPRGALEYWNDDKLVQFGASKTRSAPKSAKLLFVPTGNFFREPDLWARFHPKELYGVVVEDKHWSVHPETLNQAIRIMAQQDNLRILSMEGKRLSLRAWRSIGDIPHPLWLNISKCKVEGKNINGDQIADLKWLQDLHLLKLSEVESSTPFLKKLAAGSSLRRLSLSKTNLTDEDVRLFSKIRALEVLSLRNLTSKSIPMEEIAILKRLKVLIVDKELLESAAPEALHKLHGIKIVVPENDQQEGLPKKQPAIDLDHEHNQANSKEQPRSEAWKKVVANLSGCKIEEFREDDTNSADGMWFDPLKTNPAEIDI